MTTVDDLPEFVPASAVARRLRVSIDALLTMADRKEFARLYLFGSRKFFRLDEIEPAIKNLVPGDPDKFRRVVAAIDAASPAPAGQRRRAASRPARGSSGPTS